MTSRLSIPTCGKLWLVAMAALLLAPRAAQAQDFNPTLDEGVRVAWALNPTDYPTAFARILATDHKGYGTAGVLAGMDFDGDGNKEFLFTTDETLSPPGPDPGILDVHLFEATGDDTYEPVWTWAVQDSSNSLPGLAYGDIDGDGKWEIYFGVPTLPRTGAVDDLFIFEQNDDGTFPSEPTTSWGMEREVSADFRPAGMQIVDADGDGQMELIVVSRTGGNRELIVASPNGDLNSFTSWTIEMEAGNDLLGGGGLYDVDVADYDGDGLMEIWASTWDKLSMTIWEATAANTYELQVDINQADADIDHGSFNKHDMNFVDIDGDGKLELMYVSTEGQLLFLDSSDDVSTITGADFQRVGNIVPANRSTRGSDVGYFDADQNLDIVVSMYLAEQVAMVEYMGGNPADSTSYVWSVLMDTGFGDDSEPLDRYYPVRIAEDLDGDGFNEIIVTNRAAAEPGQRSIIILEATALGVAVEDLELPSAFALEQNYPNPFNPTTSFRYMLDEAATISVKVYDVTGRLVKTLVPATTMAAGTYEASWDGTNAAGISVASGSYFYTLESGDQRISKMMLLVK